MSNNKILNYFINKFNTKKDDDIENKEEQTLNSICDICYEAECMDCQSLCEGSCQSCQTGCQISCQSGCESNCQSGCETDCQQICQIDCQCASEGCMHCQTTCELSCQNCLGNCETACELNCQCTVQGCQTCQCSTQGCQTYCLNYCEDICEKECQSACESTCEKTCQSCQSTCELSCQTACELNCQTCETTCEKNCQSDCEDYCQCASMGCMSCQATCELNCQCTVQGCQTCQCSTQGCQTYCLNYCEDICEKECQNACESTCEKTCQSCQDTCELSCQTTCELNCQTCETTCEKNCQSDCEDYCQCASMGCMSCQATCELSCQNCLGNCETTCELNCQNNCELACQDLSENANPIYENESVHYGETGVNPGTGNYSETFTDMSIDSPGFKINISRTYNSKDDRLSKSFGRGWTFGFEGYIQGSTTVSVRLPDGGSCMFTKNADSTYTPSDSRNKLEKLVDGTYILTTKDQYKYKFNTSGYLISMIDKNNNAIDIAVNSNGNVTNISDLAGLNFIVAYNADGLIDTITEQASQSLLKYEYQNKLLYKVTDSMGNYIIYNYDTYSYLNSIKDQNANIISQMEYDHINSDNLHKLTKFTDSYGNIKNYTYDTTANKTTIMDSNNRSSITWYDSSNYEVNHQDPEGKIAITDYYLVNNENKYGEEISHTDRNGNKTDYIRDSTGNIVKVTNPDASYKEYQYDDKNNKIYEKDEAGNSTYYIYDTQKINLIKKVQPLNGTDVYSDAADQSLFAITNYEYYTDEEAHELLYKISGLLKSVTSPEGNVTIYTYDSEGHVKTVTDPETLKVTTYEYNNLGLRTAEVSARGYRTEFEYNKNMQLHKKVIKSINNETTVTIYDCRGRKIKEISPNEYNSADDVDDKTYNGDYGSRYEYKPTGLLWKAIDSLNNIFEYSYDIYGNKIAETRPDGGIFAYEYDILNRINKILFKENPTAASDLLEKFFYDILPDKKTQTIHRIYTSNSEYADTKYVYDYEGKLISKINPDNTVLLTNYNSNGTINNTVDEKGKTTYYKYDGLNRLTEKWTPVDEASGVIKYSYSKIEYDKDGNKKTEKISAGKVELNEMPGNFLITNYEYYKDGKVKQIFDSAGRTTEYWYDDDKNISRIESLIDNSNKEITVYENNYLGLPDTKTVYIKSGNIYGNDFNNIDLAGLITKYAYDKNKNLFSETDPNNITTTYMYDKLNRRIETSKPGLDEYGNIVTILNKTSYNFEGKVETTTDANNNVTTYVNNKRGFLEKVIYPSPDGGTALYAYDLAGRKTDEVMPESYDSSKTIQQMNRITYSYDSMGTQIIKTEIFDEKIYNLTTNQWDIIPASKVTGAFKYDEKGQVIKELDGESYNSASGTTVQDKINNGYGIEYKYNLSGKCIESLDAVSKERGLPYTAKYDYDALNRKVKETDASGRIKNFEYDLAGNIAAIKHQDTITSPEITLESRLYDLQGNVLSITDGNGNAVTFEYNELNKLRKETHPADESIPANIITYQYDTAGNLKSKIDSLSRQELYVYDNEGRILSKTEQKSDMTEAITTSTRYDKAGNSRFEIDGNGNVAEKTYDSLNRIKTTSIKVKDINNVETTHITTFIYDKNGNKTSETDWRGNTITFVYDGINRLIEKIDPYNKSIEKIEYNKNDSQVKSYDALNNLTIFEYDKNKRLVKTTDPGLHSEGKSYDNAGNVKTKTDGNNKITTYNYDGLNRLLSVLNAKGETTSYSYDAAGNVLTQTDGRGNTTTFEYGVRNQVKKRIDSGGRSGSPGNYIYVDSKVESCTYYEDGKTKTIKDRNGKTANYNYDIHGRLKNKITGTSSVSYTYDNNGNMLTLNDASGITVRTYDALNRVLEKDSPNIGNIVFNYDIITGVDAGETAERTTDPKGNTTLKAYDRAGRVKSIASEGRNTVYEYYDNGSKKTVQYQDGSREEFSYFKDNLLKTLLNKKADGTVFENYSYSYDAAHNQISKTDKKGTTNYTYDELNRLKTVTEPSGKVTAYEFDASGNRTKETVTESGKITIKTYSYNVQNRLTAIDSTGNAKTIAYSYDNNGNLLTEQNGSKITISYSYDGFNQLIQTLKGNVTIKAKYNGEGKRIEREVNGAVTRFLYEGDSIILEVNSSGDELARNIYGTNLVQRKVTGTMLNYFYDGQGDVTALINGAGIIAATYYYDAFGNITETAGAADNPIRYRGYQYDGETGLYYLMSRMYCPITARFLQEDSYRGDRYDPLSLNLYTYCHNEPIMYADADGHTAYVSDGSEYGGGIGGVIQKGDKGEYVADVQRKLNDNGYNVKVDGIYGPQTEADVKDYQKNHGLSADGEVGIKTLTSLYTHKKITKPTSSKKPTDKIDEKDKGTKTNNIDKEDQKTADSLTDVAEKELARGFHEIKGNNITPYGDWYEKKYKRKFNPNPWCAVFVSYCADQAGILNSVVPSYVLVTDGINKYKKRQKYKASNTGYIPKAGDVIFFKTNINNKKVQYHTGIVIGYDSKTKRIYTIEGNSGNTVAAHYYKLSDGKIIGYGVNGGTDYGHIIKKATPGSRYSTR